MCPLCDVLGVTILYLDLLGEHQVVWNYLRSEIFCLFYGFFWSEITQTEVSTTSTIYSCRSMWPCWLTTWAFTSEFFEFSIVELTCNYRRCGKNFSLDVFGCFYVKNALFVVPRLATISFFANKSKTEGF